MKIFHLTDYQGRFGSKHNDVPYRSGFNLDLLKRENSALGIETVFVPFSDINVSDKKYQNQYVAYTSTEDPGYHYKDFIEDIVQALELSGAIMLPKSIFLRATNNKVFMEKLRELYFPEQAVLFATQAFGCLDELTRAKIDAMEFPVIVKTAQGASGSGVFLAHDPSELLRVAKKVSRTRYIGEELWDIGRYFKHTGYRRESLYRKRFIVQKFIPGLKNDWKVYVFGSMYYIFFRPILKHRLFKASGGGYHNYAYGDQAQFPQGIFDYAKGIYDKLAVPHVSLDIAFDGQKFYLLEFQSLYFGTAGIINSNCYYSQKDGNTWAPRFKKNTIESVFAGSIHDFVMKEKDR